MKKLSLMIAALALVLGTSQCKKQENSVLSGEKQHIVLSASNGNDGSKVNVGVSGSLLNLTWETNDVIAVSGGASGELHLTGGAGTADATFEGDIELNRAGDIVFSVGSNNCMGQTGTLDGLKERIYLVGTSEYKEDRNYDVTMKLQYAVLMLDLSAFADDTKGEEVTVTITSGEEPLASVTGITASSKAVYVALPADEAGSKKYTFNNGKGMNAEKTWTLAANGFYTANGSDGPTGNAIVMPAYPVGALSGLFTIDDYGTKVYFSKGNLQYNMNTTAGADKWRFAPNQYECIGSANEDNVQDTTATTDTWIDLFGWGTSGNNHGAVCYQPWSTSQTDNDYWAYSNQNNSLYDGEGEMKGKADWGANAISNGGGSTWRTLTTGEWVYLIKTRMVNGATGYGHTCVRATVEGVYGLIIFHDGYKGTTSGLTSIPEGCVFLPAAGRRYGTEITFVGLNGCYWSSSNDNSYAKYFFFNSDEFSPNYTSNRCIGYSVRLVSVK